MQISVGTKDRPPSWCVNITRINTTRRGVNEMPEPRAGTNKEERAGGHLAGRCTGCCYQMARLARAGNPGGDCGSEKSGGEQGIMWRVIRSELMVRGGPDWVSNNENNGDIITKDNVILVKNYRDVNDAHRNNV